MSEKMTQAPGGTGIRAAGSVKLCVIDCAKNSFGGGSAQSPCRRHRDPGGGVGEALRYRLREELVWRRLRAVPLQAAQGSGRLGR